LAFATFLVGGYGLALAALALVVFGAYESYPVQSTSLKYYLDPDISSPRWNIDIVLR